jgi:hypothetical protein
VLERDRIFLELSAEKKTTNKVCREQARASSERRALFRSFTAREIRQLASTYPRSAVTSAAHLPPLNPHAKCEIERLLKSKAAFRETQSEYS